MIFHPVTKLELVQITGQLKNKKSWGVDEFSMVVLKNKIGVITDPIFYIINSLLLAAYFRKEL